MIFRMIAYLAPNSLFARGLALSGTGMILPSATVYPVPTINILRCRYGVYGSLL